MANINEERIVIVTKTKEYMAEILEKMCENVLSGPARENYFKASEFDAAKGNADELYAVLQQTEPMNKLCLFSTEPDTRSEGSWMPWRIEEINGFYIFAVDIDLKWSPSEQPSRFCAQLDKDLCAYSISDGGEACQWEDLMIDDEWIDGCDVPDKVEEAEKKKNKTKSMKKLAYYYNLAGINADLYGDSDW